MKLNSNSSEKTEINVLTDTSIWKKTEIFIKSNYDLQYNEVSNEVECKDKDQSEYTPLNENNLFRDLQLSDIKVSMNNLLSLLRSDFVTAINPFHEYFNSLPTWEKDSTDYIDTLANFVKAKDQKQFNHHFKKMLVRTVACALHESYFNKHAFIIIGKKQNTGKSTWIRFLCPPALYKYISENLIYNDKDNQISLSENIIINIDELAALSKVEINGLKSFFSKDKVKIRHPYDKKSKTSARRASFFGSTNKTEFLSDETGSVRWICFEIENIDWTYKSKIEINNVWSQAYYLLKNNFQYQLTAAEISENEQRNKSYQQTSIEMELIQAKYRPGTIDDYDAFYVTTDFVSALSESVPARININTVTIGRALTFLGFERVSKRVDGFDNPTKGYYIKFYKD